MEQNRRELFESLKLLSARRQALLSKYYEDKSLQKLQRTRDNSRKRESLF